MATRYLCAALYVEPVNYSSLHFVDLWSKHRDARNYRGVLPVVATPPSRVWNRFAPANYKRLGGDHNKPGNDGGSFLCALEAVKRCGGVLVHPAHSRAFKAHGIKKPIPGGWQKDTDGAWVTQVWKSTYGHRDTKAFWLYYVGTNRPLPMLWEKQDPDYLTVESDATPIIFNSILVTLAINANATHRSRRGRPDDSTTVQTNSASKRIGSFISASA